MQGTLSGNLQLIPSGAAGTRATLKIMGRLVKDGKKNLAVRQAALFIVGEQTAKDWRGEINALFEFVRDQIRYVRDIRDVETLHTADKVLELGQGDCDDKSILLASLLETIGHPTRFCAVGFTPDEYAHVLVQTKLADEWVSLETTEQVGMGWEPAGVVACLIFHN